MLAWLTIPSSLLQVTLGELSRKLVWKIWGYTPGVLISALLGVGFSSLAPREMGCALSGSGITPGKTILEFKPGPSAENPRVPKAGARHGGEGVETGPFPLADTQKARIQESWRILHDNIAQVGIIVFIRLFETHPECKDAFFLFRDIDDLQQLKRNKELQAHGLRVMSFIEKSVARLDQEDKLEHLAFELGRSHCRYDAPPKYYEYVGIQFISAVRPIFKERWTPEVEEAWQSLFKYLTATMKRGYYKEKAKLGSNKSLALRKPGTGSFLSSV